MSEWRSISEAHNLPYGTVADLRMASGRIYRATWDYRVHVCAWWPDDGRRKRSIGLYNPDSFRIVAIGSIPADNWLSATARATRLAARRISDTASPDGN